MSGSITVRELKIDDEFQNLIPPASADELAELRVSVAQHGFTSPVTAWRNEAGEYLLLDGHQRFHLWRDGASNVYEPAVMVLNLASRDEAKAHIITLQLARRNLSAIDRIALVRKREPLIRAMARENQNVGSRFARAVKGFQGLMNSSKANESVTPHEVTPINSRQELAASANVSEQTFANAATILDAVADGQLLPDIVEDIRNGTTSIHAVAKGMKTKPSRKTKASGWQAAVKAFSQVVRRFIRRDPSHISEIAASLRAIADEIERNV